jgi:hypothetical protein
LGKEVEEAVAALKLDPVQAPLLLMVQVVVRGLRPVLRLVLTRVVVERHLLLQLLLHWQPRVPGLKLMAQVV